MNLSTKLINNYMKPIQCRKIPRKYRSYRGTIRTTKNHLIQKAYDYESSLERDFLILADHDRFCYDMQVQPAFNESGEGFSWYNENGIKHITYPDIWTIFQDGKQIIWQIKPLNQLKSLKEDQRWNKELEELEKECIKRGWELRLVTERDIRTPRLTNINYFRSAALHPPEKEKVNRVIQILLKKYKDGKGRSFDELAKFIEQTAKIFPKNEIMHILRYLIYHQTLIFDWDRPIVKSTIIFLNIDDPIYAQPLYNIKPAEITVDYTNSTSINMSDEKSLNQAMKRFSIIKPLLENPHRTKEAVNNVSREQDISSATIYNWIQKFTELDFNGLISKSDGRGNRTKRFSEDVEELINKYTEKYQQDMKKRSKKSLYNELQLELQELGLDPALIKYSSFTRRIRLLPNKLVFGKQGNFHRSLIPASTRGTLPVGLYPLNKIQMDHTLLDIVLVDQEFRLPVGRPWITVALDTYSRMVFGYYLAYNHPNSSAVTTTLMQGILPKESLLKKHEIEGNYPIYGIPSLISLDNAREFDSNHLKEFCSLYNIDREFREVKRPDHGAYVERFFGSLNNSIGNSNLPGYASPLAERADNYNPDIDAINGGLTLNEFEKWLLIWIVKIYHEKYHSTLKKSPVEQYFFGLRGDDKGFGSQPYLPDINLIRYHILVPSIHKYSLGREGIHWNHNKYNIDQYGNIHPYFKKLRKTRKKRPIKLEFRYDPRDITHIWVHDRSLNVYHPIFISKGLLRKHIERNQNTPVSISEYLSIVKREKKRNVQMTDMIINKAISESREILDESLAKSKQARKKKALMKKKNANLDTKEEKSAVNGKKILKRKKKIILPDTGNKTLPHWKKRS